MDDFRSQVESAQKFEFTNVFGGNKGGNLVQPKTEANQIADQIRVQYASRVFVIWKPYDMCPRCSNDINSGEVLIPSEGDYTCPHNENAEYEKVVNLCLSGKALLQKQEFFNRRESDARCVHIMWMVADPAHIAELERKQKEKEKDTVYPPNPKKVFSEEYDNKSAEPTGGSAGTASP
jgi:predicted P-loop ATPase/GTPase